MNSPAEAKKKLDFGQLAPREQEFVRLVCEEALSHKEVAARMGLGYSMTKCYAMRVATKVGAHSTVELVVLYWKRRMALAGCK